MVREMLSPANRRVYRGQQGDNMEPMTHVQSVRLT